MPQNKPSTNSSNSSDVNKFWKTHSISPDQTRVTPNDESQQRAYLVQHPEIEVQERQERQRNDSLYKPTGVPFSTYIKGVFSGSASDIVKRMFTDQRKSRK